MVDVIGGVVDALLQDFFQSDLHLEHDVDLVIDSLADIAIDEVSQL